MVPALSSVTMCQGVNDAIASKNQCEPARLTGQPGSCGSVPAWQGELWGRESDIAPQSTHVTDLGVCLWE